MDAFENVRKSSDKSRKDLIKVLVNILDGTNKLDINLVRGGGGSRVNEEFIRWNEQGRGKQRMKISLKIRELFTEQCEENKSSSNFLELRFKLNKMF